jgi:PKD repeat protein
LSISNQSFYTFDYDEIFPIIHVGLYNYNDRQIEDLEKQLDLTILNYFKNNLTVEATVTSSEISTEFKIFYFSSTKNKIAFNSWVVGQNKFYPDQLPDLPPPGHAFDIELFNFTSSEFDEVALRVNETLYRTFYLAADFDEDTKAHLISSIQNLTGDSSFGEESIVAAFTATQTEMNYYQVILDGGFSYSQWSGPLSYTWDFGDGKTETNMNLSAVNHTYHEAGNYTITLTVIDRYLNSAKASTRIEILYTLAEVTPEAKVYIGGRSQDWMSISGNVYTPLHPFAQGSYSATMFQVRQTSESIYSFKVVPEIPALIDNYLGIWGYDSVRPEVRLQASSLSNANIDLVTPARFTVSPLTGDFNEGYYSIKYGNHYLNVYGGLNDIFDNTICAFTFVTEPIKEPGELKSLLASAGVQDLADVQILSFLDSRHGLQAPSGSPLFNFNAQGDGFYTVSDNLNPYSLLTSIGMKKAVQMFEPSESDNQLWHIQKGDKPEKYNLISKSNSLCLKLDIVSETLIQDDCNAVNLKFCHDRQGNYIYNTPDTCKEVNDMICANRKLLLIPFVGIYLYHKSMHPCKSGKYYCQLAEDQTRVITESTKFPSEPCTSRNEATPEILWTFNHTSAANIQQQWMNVWTQMLELNQWKKLIKNIGTGLFLQLVANGRPYLTTVPRDAWDVVTYGSEHAQADPDQIRWGYLIAGYYDDAAVNGWYMTGDAVSDRYEIWTRKKKSAIPHYWILEQAGYNVFRFVYMKDEFDQERVCATAAGSGEGSLLNLRPCDAYNPYQYWSIYNN